MRSRDRILQSLERVYREAFEEAEARGDERTMARLELEYQRDQIELEVLLDLRALLEPAEEGQEGTSLIEKAQKLRRLTKLR